MKHRIRSVDFTAARRLGIPAEDAQLVCECGEWMLAKQHWAHRKGLGLKSSGHVLAPEEYAGQPAWMRASSRKGNAASVRARRVA